MCFSVLSSIPPSIMSPPLCEGGGALCPPPPWLDGIAKMKADIFWGGNTCVVYRKVLLAVHRFLC